MHDVDAAEGRSAVPPVVTPEECRTARDTRFVHDEYAREDHRVPA
jgi:hypothetical protein